MLTLRKKDLSSWSISVIKKRHFMLMKESVYQEDITIQIYLKEHISTLFLGNSPIYIYDAWELSAYVHQNIVENIHNSITLIIENWTILKLRYIHPVQYYTATKTWTTDTCTIIDSQKHYAKWKKPVSKPYIQHDVDECFCLSWAIWGWLSSSQ